MQACGEGVESISSALENQKIAIVDEARKKEEEEADRLRIVEERAQEARQLTQRLVELGINVGANAPNIVNDDEGSDSDDDLVTHDPVRRMLFLFYQLLTTPHCASHAVIARARTFVAKVTRARHASPATRRMLPARYTAVSIPPHSFSTIQTNHFLQFSAGRVLQRVRRPSASNKNHRL